MSSELHRTQEALTLKSDINTLSTALSASLKEETSPISPPTLRWLSLSHFHARSRSWDWHTDLHNSVNIANADRKQGPDSRLRRLSADHSINLDGSTLGDSEELEPQEKARMRMVAVLRSYFWNLSEGMLVSGEKVDGEVAKALKQLIKGMTAFDKESEKGKGKRKLPDIGLSEEITSDEEAVVAEIEEYKRCLVAMGNGSEVPQTVVELAKKILDWGSIKGLTQSGVE